jgi:hypothetical protein
MAIFIIILLWKGVNPVPKFTIISIVIQIPEVISGFSDVLYCLLNFGTGSTPYLMRLGRGKKVNKLWIKNLNKINKINDNKQML